MNTLLVIDDDVTVHDVLNEVLSREYEIISAYNGDDGVKKYAKNRERVSLILLDMTMPDMTGLETLAELARLKSGGTPVVMLTSVDESKIESACIEAGAIDYIKKPINVKVMKSRIAAHISLNKSAGNAETEALVRELSRIAADIAEDALTLARGCPDGRLSPALLAAMAAFRDAVREAYPK